MGGATKIKVKVPSGGLPIHSLTNNATDINHYMAREGGHDNC